jgi:hypothetical protein
LKNASVSSHKNEQSHHPGASAPGFFHIPPIRLTDNRQGSQPISGNKEEAVDFQRLPLWW